MLAWSKRDAGLEGKQGPFVAKAEPKGDGRWNWSVYADAADNPAATGVAASLGAAKTACENYVQRSGRV